MKYQVIVESDSDNPENNGSVIYEPTSEEEANAFVMGAEYANDSALIVGQFSPQIGNQKFENTNK